MLDEDLTKPAGSDTEAIRRIDNCFALTGDCVASQDWQRVKALAQAARQERWRIQDLEEQVTYLRSLLGQETK